MDTLPEDSYRRQVLEFVTGYYQGSAGDSEFLPSVICQTLLPNGIDRAVPITAAWQLVRLAAKIYDDVEDGEIKEDIPNTLNFATGCLFAAQLALTHLTKFEVNQEKALLVMKRFAQFCLCACAGQHADLSANKNPLILDPDGWLKIASLKSGELFAWAAWSGSVVASNDEEIQLKFLELGRHMGIMVQIADDFNGLWGKDDEDDLTQGKSSLPICYARLVAQGQERELLERCLIESTQGNLTSAKASREIIVRLGGQSFLISAAWLERRKAVNILRELPILFEKKEGILSIFGMVQIRLT